VEPDGGAHIRAHGHVMVPCLLRCLPLFAFGCVDAMSRVLALWVLFFLPPPSSLASAFMPSSRFSLPFVVCVCG